MTAGRARVAALGHGSTAIALATLIAGCTPTATASPASPPELPRETVDVSWPTTGRVVRVAAGEDLQAALDRARPGDEIVLEPRARHRGPFRLPKIEGDGWVVLRTDALDRLPSSGARAGLDHAEWMPVLESTHGAVIHTEPGASRWRLVGLEIRPRFGTFLTNVVDLGSGAHEAEAWPSHVVIDRCWIHGDASSGSRRGVAMNGRHLAVVDSTLTDFKERGADSQAIAAWDGPGPLRIENNRLEGAGENLLLGGADPIVPRTIPSDVVVRGNHLTKPLAWRMGDPTFGGQAWSVKNLLELKNARRVLIERNLLEHVWIHAQSGFAVVFTVRNQDGGAPWSTIEDVTFRENLVRRASSGLNVLGKDDLKPSGHAARILVADNAFVDVGGPRWGGSGILLQSLRGTRDLVVEGNTALHHGRIVMAEGEPHQGFRFRRNLVLHNEYGFLGTGTGVGRPTLERYFPDAVLEGNVLVGAPARLYPPKNAFPPSLARTVDVADDGLPSARARGDVGADPERLREVLRNAREGVRPATDAP